MISRMLAVCLLVAGSAYSQKYAGPRPSKPDVPFLLHATKLLETDSAEAKEESRKDGTAFLLGGVAATAKTPLAEPIFLFESQKIPPEKLQLWKLEVKNGRREIFLPQKRKKDSPRPVHLSITKLGGGLYRIEANETLENGEYALTPDGSNQVFSFQVY
jgi:hypothetical protein